MTLVLVALEKWSTRRIGEERLGMRALYGKDQGV